jgi:hypothetical protein
MILSFFISCYNNDSLDNQFKKVIIDYQNKYPIPTGKVKTGKYIFIYSVNFKKNGNDTILEIKRTSSGIDSIISKRSGDGGIYEDKELKPTLIIDNYKLGTKFILKKNIKIDKKYYNCSEIFNEGFTPIHTYKISNKNIELIKIDTVWKHWD